MTLAIRQKLAYTMKSVVLLTALGIIGIIFASVAPPATAQAVQQTAQGTQQLAAQESTGLGASTTNESAVGILSASGCTFAPHGYVCGGVRGSGLHVREAYVVRGKRGTEFICNYRGRVTVYHNDRLIYSRWSSRHQGCTPLRAHFTLPVHRNFPHKSKLCTSFYERGVRQGTVCFTIKR